MSYFIKLISIIIKLIMTEIINNKIYIHLFSVSIHKLNYKIVKYILSKYFNNFINNFYDIIQNDKYNYIRYMISKYFKKLTIM